MIHYQWEILDCPRHQDRENILNNIQDLSLKCRMYRILYQKGSCSLFQLLEVSNTLRSYKIRMRKMERELEGRVAA